MRDPERTSSGAVAFIYLTLLVVLSCTVPHKNEAVSDSEAPPARPVQDQKEEGTDETYAFVGFRGRGNEPGWSLQIGSDNIVFVTNYGSERYQFPTPLPEVSAGEQETTYRARGDGHELVIVIEAKECQDTMADETFEMTVSVTLDGKSLNGCGTPLP